MLDEKPDPLKTSLCICIAVTLFLLFAPYVGVLSAVLMIAIIGRTVLRWKRGRNSNQLVGRIEARLRTRATGPSSRIE
jgi:hypothetical protein